MKPLLRGLVASLALAAAAQAAQPPPDDRTARALSRLLGVEVSAEEVTRYRGDRLLGGVVPSPLEEIVGQEARSFLAVELSSVRFRGVHGVSFAVPRIWAETLLADVVYVTSDENSATKPCSFGVCTNGSCNISVLYVPVTAVCPTSLCGGGQPCPAETESCVTRACLSNGTCGVTTIQAPVGNCPDQDLCTDSSDCQSQQECQQGDCSCLMDRCVCFSYTTTQDAGTVCDPPECTNDDECSASGGGGILDDIAETLPGGP